MAGLLDEFAMRDHLRQAQAPAPRFSPHAMAIMQRQAFATSQRLGISYQQALEEAMRRAAAPQEGPTGPLRPIPLPGAIIGVRG